MAKRVVGYVPIGDGTKDRGEELCAFEFFDKYFEEIETNYFGFRKRALKTILASDILYIDCYKGSDLRNEAATGALAGGILFGLPGAIIGGILGQNQNSWYCKVVLPDSTMFFRLYKNEWDRDFILKWAKNNGIQIGHTEEIAKALAFDNGKQLQDIRDSATSELEDPLDVQIEVDISEINQRLANLGPIATSEFYRLKKHIDYFTEEDIFRLEAMERSEKYKH